MGQQNRKTRKTTDERNVGVIDHIDMTTQIAENEGNLEVAVEADTGSESVVEIMSEEEDIAVQNETGHHTIGPGTEATETEVVVIVPIEVIAEIDGIEGKEMEVGIVIDLVLETVEDVKGVREVETSRSWPASLE